MNLKSYIVYTSLLMSASGIMGQDAAAPVASTGTGAAPKPPAWESSVAAGLTLTSGNSDTLMINAVLQTAKKWDHNEVNLGADGTYGEDDGAKNADSYRVYGQYNRLFTDRFFGYARAEGLHDGIADVDYRVTLSPGVGYYFIKNAQTALRAEVGPGWVAERQGGIDDNYITLRIAERFDHKLSDRIKIWQALEFLPQLDDWNNYIVNFEVGLEVALSKVLSQRTFLQDTYDNQPAAGRDKNDLKLVVAVAYKF